jgi:hypothetical protein
MQVTSTSHPHTEGSSPLRSLIGAPSLPLCHTINSLTRTDANNNNNKMTHETPIKKEQLNDTIGTPGSDDNGMNWLYTRCNTIFRRTNNGVNRVIARESKTHIVDGRQIVVR